MVNSVQAEVVLSESEHLPAVDVWLVVDILRATTVMVRWFEMGGAVLYPAESVEGAVRLAQKLRERGETPLLMGERNAIAPQGFDLGNSPLDITQELCKKYSCAVMATTNGTKALLKASVTGTPVLIACARNAVSALELALSKGRRIGIFCSGRKGRPAWDDTLCAGLLVACLTEHFPNIHLADSARLSLLAWQRTRDFGASLKTADHAVFLEKIGFGDDIAYAAEVDVARTVPELHELPEGSGMIACLREGLSNAPARSPLRKALPETLALPEPASPAETPGGREEPLSFSGEAEIGLGHVFLGGENFKKQRKSRLKKHQ
ncbi:MAG: 2-phosphosulfolactate phosphatase [Synergistaceae bacterium]|jgi:2-phosphosulfolactate phosphatase|nr:2-phosphosulfolactate phosphatase [Synergistaceae bacterium]